ncbi:lipase 1 [Rhypophila decipiens]|uniref:Carboxylic ester hydrolase n=1 Tax=Rhypophila decipiens TaxID=261697 RepID=A0AAN6YHB9_9PEZI|nr:lipase 1 [Rhypophila decipiens]
MDNAPRVVLPQGTYVGIVLEKSRHFPTAVEAFLGVPYGQSTAGENRFRPPKRLPTGVTNRVRVYEAKRVGEVCPAMGKVGGGFGEDCLNLNVYRTAGVVGQAEKRRRSNGPRDEEEVTKEALLPIAVYIHGGGFNMGNGNERNMGSFVSWAKEPMIGVNFNYRVGALGFLPSAVTAREGLLNLGLRDQQLLLEWVKENAGAFGGDADNITIMGLSAGAHSIGHHIMYYANSSTPAPFHKAILESGATTARAVLLPTHPRHLIQFREFLIACNLEGVPEEEIFARLREVPIETIAKASRSIWDLYEPSVTWPFQPVIDGPNLLANSSTAADTPSIIPDLPIHSWRKGKHLRIPVLTGFNSNEGTVFVPANANTNSEFRSFFRALIPGLTAHDLDELEKLYPDPVTHLMSPYRSVPSDKGRQWARLDAAYSHYAYICPVLQTAHFLSNMTDAKVPVYIYRYAAKGNWGTANHGDETPIVAHDVGFLDNNGGMPGLTAVSDAMHAAWSTFVISKSGNITSTGLTKTGEEVLQWPEFKSPFSKEEEKEAGQKNRRWLWGLGSGDGPSGDTGRILVFGEGNDERMGPDNGKMAQGVAALVKTLSAFELDACRFWWSRIELSQGLGKREGGEEGDGPVKAKL